MILPKCALVREAIMHIKKKQQGVNLLQICKHLEATYEEKLDAKKNSLIFDTFKILIQEGKLLQMGTIYKSTKQHRVLRADIPQRRVERRRKKNHGRRRHHRRWPVGRKRHHNQRRHHRKRHHGRKRHRIHVQRTHRRKIKARHHEGEISSEYPDYTNSVPSVEVPSTDKLLLGPNIVNKPSVSQRSETSRKSRTSHQ